MVERAAVTQVTQLGVETTPGTAVAADKLLPSVSLVPSIKAENQVFGANGFKVNTLSSLGKEWSEWDIKSDAPTYDEIVYLLAAFLAYAAPAQQGATTAYKWTHAPSGTVADTIKTLTAEWGSAVRAAKAAHLFVNELTLSGDRSGVKLSGSALAQALTDGITLTSTPTAIAQIPILAKDATIYADDASGDLGTTKLTRLSKWELKLGPRFSPVWPVDKAQTSFAAIVEKKVPAEFTIMVQADAQGMGLLTTMRNAARKFLRLDIVSDLLAGTAIPYRFRVDLAGNVADVEKFEEDDDVVAIKWKFDLQYDTTWAKWLQIEVTNKLTTL